MAKSNLLNTRTTNLLELVGNGRIYRVPPYQRDYWEIEQWEDLWNDLLGLRGKPDDRHYMGALVVEGKSDREFLIIDGQQRLATLSLLGLAVIAKLEQIASTGTDPEPNRERAARLRSRFIGEKDPASLIESSKLFLNETDDGFSGLSRSIASAAQPQRTDTIQPAALGLLHLLPEEHRSYSGVCHQ
jgi:uncharacterized protein with ParB-like and HNH nuclease domain